MYTNTYDVNLTVIHILTVACTSSKEGQHTILEKMREVLIKSIAVELGI